MENKVYLACIGTRPEIIKMAPIYKELQSRGDQMLLVHTGQHAAMAESLYDFFDMPPDISINLQRKSSSLAHLTSALLEGVDEAVTALQPDVVMVQGDTTSALVGAMIGYYHNKPVAHIEAGLRTHEREPFPEEKNREMIGRLAHWHFPPTRQARLNLLNEGISSANIFEVGNTVIDAALWTHTHIMQPSFELAAALPENLRKFNKHYPTYRLVLVTAHRRENWGMPIRNIAQAVAKIVSDNKDVIVVWPVHPNPSVRADVETQIHKLPAALQLRICLTEPLGYEALIALLGRCEFTLTDSGGIQEEASAFGKPVLVARNSTERQELVDAGGARLVGTEVEDIVYHAQLLLSDKALLRSMQLDKSPFGDGNAARNIVDVLSRNESRAEIEAPVSIPAITAPMTILELLAQ